MSFEPLQVLLIKWLLSFQSQFIPVSSSRIFKNLSASKVRKLLDLNYFTMATLSVGKKALLLGLLVAALVATAFCATSEASAEASVTISNPATTVANVLVGDKNVKVVTDVITVHLDHPEQDIQIQTAEGRATELHVQNGDVLVVNPDLDDYDYASVQVLSDPPVKPSVTPMEPGIRAPPSPSR